MVGGWNQTAELFFLGGLTLFAGGPEGGESTIDESEFFFFFNAVASAVVLGDRGVRVHYVLTFIYITFPANSALASLQASRKCNKIEGCVLSPRSEEELLKGRSPCAQLATAFQKGRADNANKPRPGAKISRPSWLDPALLL